MEPTRRTVLGGLGVASLLAGLPGIAQAVERGEPAGPEGRRARAYRIRVEAAAHQRDRPLPVWRNNGDEAAYANRIGNYGKGLPHDGLGRVDTRAYETMRRAVSGDGPGDFESIPRGGDVALTNPHAAYTFTLVGADSHHLDLEPPPSFGSARNAAELAELYWQALCRDIPFTRYDSDPLVAAACADLSRLTDHDMPTRGGRVTPATLFRGGLPQEMDGPHVSQFLLQDVPFGPMDIRQAYRVATAGDDHMTSYDEWLGIIRGAGCRRENRLDGTLRYLRCGRDLAEYSHQNFSYQPYLLATLKLISYEQRAWDPGNPYRKLRNQQPGVTFDWTHPLDVVARAAFAAQKASFFQKWCLHRRLRPEEFAGHVHNHALGRAAYPLDPQLLTTEAANRIHHRYGGLLLPMAYPEGCPTHPSYTAAHATVAGACATVLKAFYDESVTVPNPVVPGPDGRSLHPYGGPALTVGGELNKLAFNVAYGRNFAGVHWRSDTRAGLALGEKVAESMLSDLRRTVTEEFSGFTFTRFDGSKATV
jgi:hypothetical protein